ncbi:MAG: RsmE family RNA methyltransferase [Pleomorphochaeta sp.]
MRQYVLPKYFKGDSEFKLNKEDSQYFIKVLRLKKKDKIFSRDQNGVPYQLTIMSYDKNSCLCKVEKINEGDTFETTDTLPEINEERPKLNLFQCVCKGKKNESIIRMATEFGVESITLIQSKFCIAKKESSNNQRYEKIIKEAIQQSGSPVITKFNDVINFKDFIKNLDMPLFFFHQISLEENLTLKEKVNFIDPKKPIGILIGPEGGLSDEECSLLLEKKAIPVTLKTNILRAETASIVALSTIHTLLVEK